MTSICRQASALPRAVPTVAGLGIYCCLTLDTYHTSATVLSKQLVLPEKGDARASTPTQHRKRMLADDFLLEESANVGQEVAMRRGTTLPREHVRLFRDIVSQLQSFSCPYPWNTNGYTNLFASAVDKRLER